MLALPFREDCPVASRFLATAPAAVATFRRGPFASGALYSDALGVPAAVVLTTPAGRVLALDDGDPDDVSAESVDSLASYEAA